MFGGMYSVNGIAVVHRCGSLLQLLLILCTVVEYIFVSHIIHRSGLTDPFHHHNLSTLKRLKDSKKKKITNAIVHYRARNTSYIALGALLLPVNVCVQLQYFLKRSPVTTRLDNDHEEADKGRGRFLNTTTSHPTLLLLLLLVGTA